jgi:hypothetical protein
MTIHKPSGPPWPCDSNLVFQQKRGPLAPFGIPGRTVMTKAANGTAELIVLGRDEAGKPRAAGFQQAMTASWPRRPRQ